MDLIARSREAHIEYPEAISRTSERRRQDRVRSYLTSVLTRDLRDIAEIERLTELPKFARLLAEHSGQLVNYSAFGSGINVTYKTSQRYVGLLEQVFLVATLQPWHTNAIKRVVKTPKLHFLDFRRPRSQPRPDLCSRREPLSAITGLLSAIDRNAVSDQSESLSAFAGIRSRLGRDLSGTFGSKKYAYEEIELSTAFVCATLGIVPTVRHADYIGSWDE